MRRFFTSPLLAIALLFIPAIITAILYSGLPETIPVHFNAEGIADKFGAKSSIWVHVSILFVVGLGVYLLLSNLHKIDPKKSAGVSVETHKAIAIIVVLFISLISTGIVLSMSKTFGNFGIQKIVLPAVGLLIAVMGYFMRSIKPNYFIGLRLPWTLEDEENWAATHQLAAKLWIPAGLLMAVSAIAFPFMTAFFITMAITLIIVIIPAIYSYRFFKNKKA
ncbi:SdpI family protein [Sediminibacterium sp.]|jgi:uncharacterized membrane protein|uniref:SdpI family protein n=1 Tax=Sediminibacterium sp. TaxID=1917865 RepID=UPI0025E2EA53|nr:SdpI family protein [Sediminibacterium sp.]MBW0177183.1 SdpI family protein [Sediminibacterium sp.]